MSRHNISDRIRGHTSLVPLKRPAFSIISALQDLKDPAVQVDALALTFAIICQEAAVDPHALITRAHRQIPDADALPNPHLEAIRDYVKGEMLR